MRIKRAYLAGACFTATMATAGLGVGSASATPITPSFQVTPDSVSTGAFPITGYAPFMATNIQGPTAAVVTQTGSNTQSETGWFHASLMENGNTPQNSGISLFSNSGSSNTYGFYIKFTDSVTGLAGSGGGQTGVVTAFDFAMYIDVGGDDTFDDPSAAGTLGSTTVGGGTGNDLVLAVGSLVSGGAGFQSPSGGPTFNTISTFILCDGVANEGTMGGVLTTPASNSQGSCGSFDASTYFTKPNPFYSVDFDSATGADSSAIIPLSATTFAITGVTATISFIGKAPEPISISLFGAGLMGLAGFGARRRKAVLA